MAKVTLITLDQKLDYALEKLMKHDEILEGNGKVGLIEDVRSLKQTEDGRKWHFRTLWGAFIATIIAWVITTIKV